VNGKVAVVRWTILGRLPRSELDFVFGVNDGRRSCRGSYRVWWVPDASCRLPSSRNLPR
jgi:hypothetical protein